MKTRKENPWRLRLSEDGPETRIVRELERPAGIPESFPAPETACPRIAVPTLRNAYKSDQRG
jgi:hypothetical protein